MRWYRYFETLMHHFPMVGLGLGWPPLSGCAKLTGSGIFWRTGRSFLLSLPLYRTAQSFSPKFVVNSRPRKKKLRLSIPLFSRVDIRFNMMLLSHSFPLPSAHKDKSSYHRSNIGFLDKMRLKENIILLFTPRLVHPPFVWRVEKLDLDSFSSRRPYKNLKQY